MGLLDRFRRTKKEASLFDRFAAWMDAAFEGGVPGEIAGVVLNLYEQADHRWSAEVVGTASFAEEDEDWACDEATDFGTRSAPFTWEEESDWDAILSKMTEWVRRYLAHGRNADRIKAVRGIAVGFVDGDLELCHRNPER